MIAAALTLFAPLLWLQSGGPAIPSETIGALSASKSDDYMVRPFLTQGGTQVPLASLPAAIVDRSNRALDFCIAPVISPPTLSQRNYVGFRKSPAFEEEYMWLTWTADGREIRWADLDPESFLLLQLKPGELQAAIEAQHKIDIINWLQAHLRYSALAGPLTARVLQKTQLPSGKTLWSGTVVSQTLEAQIPNEPETIAWATGISYWTDGTVLCIELQFPSLRPVEQGSVKGPGSLRSSSRFDFPTISGNVGLQNWVGAVSGQSVQIDVKDAVTGNLLVTNRTQLGLNGSFSVKIPTLSAGTYTLTAKGSHWLSQGISYAITSTGADGVSFSLKNGDCNGDNAVTLGDFAMVRNGLNSHIGDPTYDARADVNGDGTINEADFDIVKARFGESGS